VFVDLGGALAAAGRRAEGRAVRANASSRPPAAARPCSSGAPEKSGRVRAPQRERFTGVDSLTREAVRDPRDGGHRYVECRDRTTSTVEKHLSPGYEKLGIERREQLADALARPQ
jgi:hypothetical protein